MSAETGLGRGRWCSLPAAVNMPRSNVRGFLMTTDIRQRPTITTLLIAMLAILAGTGAQAAGPGDSLEDLTPAQASVARQMLAFMADTETRFWQRVDRLNGAAPPGKSDPGPRQ